MDLVLKIYKLTRTFPKEELYGLTSQLRSAAVSVPSNIAEGKGRTSDRELVQFLCHARGSLFEVETQVRLAENSACATKETGDQICKETKRVGQMLNALIRSVRPAA